MTTFNRKEKKLLMRVKFLAQGNNVSLWRFDWDFETNAFIKLNIIEHIHLYMLIDLKYMVYIILGWVWLIRL